MRIDITIPRKPRNRRSPRARIRVPAGNIARDGRAREPPDTDRLACPLGRVHAAAGVIEPCTVRQRVVRVDAAAGVCGLAGGADVAVACGQGASEAGVGDGAAAGGVEGHVVAGLLVDAFDDVDFAVFGPVAAEGPAGEC
jgi:hypothetical protein